MKEIKVTFPDGSVIEEDYLYIIRYYDEHRDELPAEAEEEIKAYKAKKGME